MSTLFCTRSEGKASDSLLLVLSPGGHAAFILVRFYSHLPPASEAASFKVFRRTITGMIHFQFGSIWAACQYVDGCSERRVRPRSRQTVSYLTPVKSGLLASQNR